MSLEIFWPRIARKSADKRWVDHVEIQSDAITTIRMKLTYLQGRAFEID